MNAYLALSLIVVIILALVVLQGLLSVGMAKAQAK